MIVELNFKTKQNSEQFDSESSKHLSETSKDTAGVHQRAGDSLQSLWCL